MKPSLEEEAARWLAEADEDLEVARVLSDTGHFSRACFHAQQGGEKALKAFLYSRGADEPWGHSVAKLIEDSASFDPALGDLRRLGNVLDRFYIPTRYPNGLPGGLPSKAYCKEDASEAIARGRELVTAIRLRLAG
jgi:HEPN domain-containing protein